MSSASAVLTSEKNGVINFKQHQLHRCLLNHWNLPEQNAFEILEVLNLLDHLDTKINEKIQEQEIQEPESKERSRFEDEFRIICKITWMARGSLPPPLKVLRTEHNRAVKKLKKNLPAIQCILQSIDVGSRSYIDNLISQSSNLPSKNLLAILDNITNELVMALNQVDDHQNYFETYTGGDLYPKNRRCAIEAMVNSYHRCFGKIPTSSENSTFSKYTAVLFELIGMYDEVNGGGINIKEHSMCLDIKNAIQKYKTDNNPLEE